MVQGAESHAAQGELDTSIPLSTDTNTIINSVDLGRRFGDLGETGRCGQGYPLLVAL